MGGGEGVLRHNTPPPFKGIFSNSWGPSHGFSGGGLYAFLCAAVAQVNFCYAYPVFLFRKLGRGDTFLFCLGGKMVCISFLTLSGIILCMRVGGGKGQAVIILLILEFGGYGFRHIQVSNLKTTINII